MTIVLDANLAVGAAIPRPDAPQIAGVLALWQQNDERLIAPCLLEYEVTSALRRAITIGILDRNAAEKAITIILNLGIELIAPSPELDKSALRLAAQIGQSKAYDAQYLALAAREGAPLWTADRRLANAARDAGLDWVHWIGEWRSEG